MGKGFSTNVIIIIIAAVALIAIGTLYIQPLVDDASKVICIDCAPGHLGGGCTYTDASTGQTIQPRQCIPYDVSRNTHSCLKVRTDECGMHYRPVCGSDAKTYFNPCLACDNEQVAFYIDDECSKITGVNASAKTQSPRNEKSEDFQSSLTDKYKVFPEVWSSNGYNGQSYEYKTNCFGNYTKLEECFLWNLTKVDVTSPNGTQFQLNKDFNIQSYSGEITRRWVLYGSAGGGLPVEGQYTFNYYENGKIVLTQKVDYKPGMIGFPRNVTWRREGNDLLVSWKPPVGMKEGMNYKVGVTPKGKPLISKVFEWNASSAIMVGLPLADGEEAEVNVGVFFRGGYSYSEYIPMVW